MPGPICFKSQLVITPRTPIATYENRSYHPLCLTCKICNKSVSGENFLKDENENLIYSKCDSIYGPKCKKCNDSFKPGSILFSIIIILKSKLVNFKAKLIKN